MSMQQSILLVDDKHPCVVSHWFDGSRGTEENPTGIAVLRIAFAHKNPSTYDNDLYELIDKVWKLRPQRFWHTENGAETCRILGTESDDVCFVFEFDERVMTHKSGVDLLQKTLKVPIKTGEIKNVPFPQTPHY